MRFGNFLVKSGVLNDTKVLEVLAKQHQRRRFVPLLAVELGYLSSAEAMQLLDEADDCQEEFLRAAQRLKLLTAKQVEELVTEWRKTAPPLGMLLVELGMITEEKRCALLKQYPGHTTPLNRLNSTAVKTATSPAKSIASPLPAKRPIATAG